jgi:hypothetical protein
MSVAEPTARGTEMIFAHGSADLASIERRFGYGAHTGDAAGSGREVRILDLVLRLLRRLLISRKGAKAQRKHFTERCGNAEPTFVHRG